MKRYLTLIVLLCVAGSATQRRTDGAYFNYYAGGFRAFCEVEAKDSAYPDGYYSDDTNDSNSSAGVEEYVEVPEAYSYAYNSIWSYAEGDSICIQTESIADGIADNASAYTSAWGYGRTEDPQTYGIYYKIMPDEGEEPGDDVIVYYSDTISISLDGPTYAYIGGPNEMDHMAITRGQLPPVLTGPNSEYEVLTWDNLEPNEDGCWFSGVHTFAAQIGDVIGIFAENYTDIAGWGLLDGVVENNLWIILTVKPVLAGDLDGDGDVDFGDFAKLAENWLAGTAEHPAAGALQAESSEAATPPTLKRYGGGTPLYGNRTKVPVRVYEPGGTDKIKSTKTLNHQLSPAGAARRRRIK